jgi:hypothetical protein
MTRKFSTPGVYLKEIDLSEVVTPAGIGSGAIALKSPKGPVNQNVVITNTSNFLDTFGKPLYTDPDGLIPDYGYGMYAALGFLQEGSLLNVVRVPTVSGTQSGSDRYAIAGTAIKTPSTDGDATDFGGNAQGSEELNSMVANGVLWVDGDTIEKASDYTGIIPELNPTKPNKVDQNNDLDGVAPAAGTYDFYNYDELVAGEASPTLLNDYIRFYLGSIGPSTDGNNISYSVEFFSDKADWAYSYDDSEEIDELLAKISDSSIQLTTADIDGLIGPRVFKIRVYTKTDNQKWASPLTTERYTEVETFLCSLEMLRDSDFNSLYITDVINGSSDYVYAVKSRSITDTELVDLIETPLRTAYYLTIDGLNNEKFFYFDGEDNLISPSNPTGVGKIIWPLTGVAGETARYDDTTTLDDTSCEGIKLENDGTVIPATGTYYLGFDFDMSEYAVVKEETNSSGVVSLSNVTYYDVTLTTNPNGAGKVVKIENRDPSSDEVYVKTQARAVLDDASVEVITLAKTEKVNRNSSVPSYIAEFGVALVGGYSVSSSDVSNVYGWDFFANKQETEADIFIVPTYNTIVKQEVANNVVGTRKDAIAVVQTGSVDADTIDDILDAEKYGYTCPSYVATYSGYYKIFDEYTSRFVYLPNMIAAVQAMVRTTNVWEAPAGQRKGIVGGIDQNITFTDTEIGIGYDNNINMVKSFRGVGTAIWGQKTAQRKASALDRINVRRTLLLIEKTVESFLNPLVLDVNNTPTTRSRVFGNIDGFLNQLRAQGGLTAYEVICDESNNGPDVVDNNTLNVDIYVQPVKTVEFIDVQVVITRTGVNFQEVRVR